MEVPKIVFLHLSEPMPVGSFADVHLLNEKLQNHKNGELGLYLTESTNTHELNTPAFISEAESPLPTTTPEEVFKIRNIDLGVEIDLRDVN